MNRCDWVGADEKMINYHDQEWGVPVHDDIKHFEFFVLDAFQAGLSWKTILHKRENFRKAFDNFDFNIVSEYKDDKISELINDAGIIRNKLKIHSAVNNARLFNEIIAKYNSFDSFIWKFTEGVPIVNEWKSISEIPPRTELSDTISKELKNYGFKFVGSTICYAYMQAAGIINDHLTSCFRRKEILKMNNNH